MRVFMKNLLKIAGIALLIGIILMIAGFSMDTTMFERPEDFSYSILGRNFRNRAGFWFGEKATTETAKKDTVPKTSYKDERDWDEDDWDEYEDNEGIGSWEEADRKDIYNDSLDYPISYKKVDSLKLDVSSGTVTIKEGETFSVDVNEAGADYVKSEVSDGILKITDSGYFNADRNDEVHVISIFGVKVRTDKNNISWPDNTRIEITLPQEFKADKLTLSIGAGAIQADSLKAKTAIVNVGAGRIRIDELNVENASSYSVGAGELIIEDFTGRDIDVECGIGAISLSGIIKGVNEVNCGIGSVEMDINGKEEDYNYDVSSGIGTVRINNNKYSGIASESIKNTGAKDSFSLKCEIGKIDLKIR
ncbi:hypothetical protein acsn021_23020 [Anaerocolumna cellulosilytica]|uniref:DUF4097 domain-containing protein n=1 Tax=Anaerocolumna cellulosilytica TaxID=433286 RepID=A0A6S6QTV0_9FIRM|nr:DUF4097 family beta strand repeat-containing protein [Anaerocolumna cellulosilytica]MBB5194053.1 hypothetical protein [Anaerocolumna cellulosilytica]BCJ94733.1 hypothetical protein acsn021_23020 [Anaerocolumna cellulosilytica]